MRIAACGTAALLSFATISGAVELAWAWAGGRGRARRRIRT
jgi:hypothetical protein